MDGQDRTVPVDEEEEAYRESWDNDLITIAYPVGMYKR